MEAIILEAKNDFRGALEMFRQIESEMTNARPADLATVIANIGVCYRQMGNYERALPQYQLALSIHEDAGNGPEACRTRWNIAETLAAAGKLSEAETRFRSVRSGFESYGMVRDAALVDLSLAEISLAKNRFEEAENLCRRVISYFQGVSDSTSSKAISALMYLKEAVEQRKANATVAEAVRKYIGRLPQQPQLLFAPPPLE